MKKLLIFIMLISTSILIYQSQEVSSDIHIGIDNLDSIFLNDIDFDYLDLELTQNELDAVEKYQSETLDFGLYQLPGYYDFFDGKPIGSNYYIYLQLQHVFNLNLQIQTDEFTPFMDRYISGEFDIVPGLHKTEMRDMYFHYSEVLYNAEIYLFSNEYIDIRSVEDLHGKTVGKATNMEPFPDGYIDKLNELGVEITVINYDNINDAVGELGVEIDYLVHTKNSQFIKQGLELFDATVLFGGLKLYFTSQEDNEMQHLLTAFEKAYNYGLRDNLEDYRKAMNNVLFREGFFFTEEQIQFIENSKTNPIKVASGSKWIPYLYEEDGELTGFGYDMFTTLSSNIGLNYHFEYDKDYSWIEMLNDLGQDGNEIKYDLGILDSITEYDGNYITFGNPIYTEEAYVVGLSSADNINGFYDLNTYEIGIIPYYAATTYLQKNLSSKEFKEYDTLDEMVTALNEGEIDYFALIKSEYDGLYYVQKNYNIVPYYSIRADFNVAMIYPTNGENTETLERLYNLALVLSDTSDVSHDYFRLSVDLNEVVQRRSVQTIMITLSVSLVILGTITWFYIYKLRQNLYVDTLTKLYNRRALFKLFKDFNYRYLYYIDFDDFKIINDKHGHITGDKVLELICSKMKTHYDGKLFRIGGDEFILLSNRKYKEYELNQEEHNTILIENKEVYISKSIGGLDVSHYEKQSIDKLITLADCAMYHAKETGKNRLVFVTMDLVNKCKKVKGNTAVRSESREEKLGDVDVK